MVKKVLAVSLTPPSSAAHGLDPSVDQEQRHLGERGGVADRIISFAGRPAAPHLGQLYRLYGPLDRLYRQFGSAPMAVVVGMGLRRIFC
uniref:hypothetical protein n=1 Tax=Micromonospora acroterricola TaxID=2202421 RepID=UPI0011B43322|nr:hypothetical protein [Micromonospora acroterricola]